jgi:hypothetical protein
MQRSRGPSVRSTRGAIRALLYGKADQSFYTRQIAREVNGSVGAVQRELENLSKGGSSFAAQWGVKFFNRRTEMLPYFERCTPW